MILQVGLDPECPVSLLLDIAYCVEIEAGPVYLSQSGIKKLALCVQKYNT